MDAPVPHSDEAHPHIPAAGIVPSAFADKIRKPAFIVAAIVALLAVAGAAYWYFGTSATVHYVTQPVTRGTVARAVTATGSINPVLTITVGSYVSGVIQEIDCDFNTKVKKGQLCARIDPRPYQMALEQAQAVVDTAKAQLVKDRADLAYAVINERRFANLIAQHAASRDSHDVALNALHQAQAQIAIDQAAVNQRVAALHAAEINLGYTSIVSPVDGTVVSRNVTMGQTVAASFQTPTLFLIATDLSKMQVDTNVSESDVGDIRRGDRAEFRVEAFPDRVFVGKVTQVRQAPQTVQNVVTYDVVVEVDNSQLSLKPGMTATVRIITARRENVLRVPDLALRYSPGGLAATLEQAASLAPHVWVLQNRKPVRVDVTAGLDDDSFSEITGGLKEGDRVIVSERTGTGGKRNGNSGNSGNNGTPSTPSMRFQ